MSLAPSQTASGLGAGASLGVLGGGQLGRMFVHAAQSLGLRVVVLDPDPASPAAAAADLHIAAPYDDQAALRSLAQQCAAITTEFENVPADALEWLAGPGGRTVAPRAQAVRICQHRASEKQCFSAAGVPCAPYRVIDSDAAVQAALQDWSGAAILKTAQLGYDGKGQVAVAQADDLPAAWASLGRRPCVLEQRLALQREISVIVARGADGQVVHLPVQQNLHRDGILAVTQVPAPDVPAALTAQAVQQAMHLATQMAYVGVLCVEFFVLADGSLVANEMAPRPHNSGHYSIDACDLSQFELQLRCLAGLPLTMPRQHSPAVMLNLLGDLWMQPDASLGEPDWARVLALPGAHLHLYGKSEARPGRKMGHLTFTAAGAERARQLALQACQLLGLPGF